jgi:hypothetical protein
MLELSYNEKSLLSMSIKTRLIHLQSLLDTWSTKSELDESLTLMYTIEKNELIELDAKLSTFKND